MNEFQIIARYFSRPAPHALLGVGDDCALLEVSPGATLAVSTDMLVEGRHFLPGTDAEALGHKALAVNLSDLAAMGATPRWALLALSLPSVDERWLEAFSRGLCALADAQAVDLVGGDTTRGPLNLCLTVMGEVPSGEALRRDAAEVGDDIWVSGAVGDAALGLACIEGRTELPAAARAFCIERLERPQPRVALGLRLRGLAHAAIDISDGFLADLGHVLERSGCGADIEFAALPRSNAWQSCKDRALAERCLLAGGDDYELCFTAPAEAEAAIRALGAELDLALTPVGRISAAGAGELTLLDANGRIMKPAARGYDHFAS